MRRLVRWGVLVPLSLLTLISTLGFSTAYADTHSQQQSTVTVWLQVMDSCQQAIPGAQFNIKRNKLVLTTAVSAGTKPQTVASAQGKCPLQRGNCVTISTGCISFVLPVPSKGTKTYKTQEISSVVGANPVGPYPAAGPIPPPPSFNYVFCTGGSGCHSQVASIVVSSTGTVSATVLNVAPDKSTATYPSSGAPYAATQSDPVVFHNFGWGSGSCDGDGDLDDHLTGTPSGH